MTFVPLLISLDFRHRREEHQREKDRVELLLDWTKKVHLWEDYYVETGEVRLRRVRGRTQPPDPVESSKRYGWVEPPEGTPSLYDLPCTSNGQYNRQGMVVRLD